VGDVTSTQEQIGIRIFKVREGMTMYDNYPRSKGQMSRSQGHVTYQQQKCYNSAMDGVINFKLVKIIIMGQNI